MFNTNIEILLVMSSQLRITQNGAVIVGQKKLKMNIKNWSESIFLNHQLWKFKILV